MGGIVARAIAPEEGLLVPKSMTKRKGAVTALGTDTSRVLGDGFTYEVALKEGLRDGQGTLELAAAGRYVGEFLAGLYHGTGTFTARDGVSYSGMWRRGTRHGRGTLIVPQDQARYEGEFSIHASSVSSLLLTARRQRLSTSFSVPLRPSFACGTGTR